MRDSWYRHIQRAWRPGRSHHIASFLTNDLGVAGLVIAMVIMIVASTSLMIFLQQTTGPARELAKLQASGAGETTYQAGLMAYFYQQTTGQVPCPDTNQDGTADACSGGATTSGTLPWRTLGMSRDDAIDPYGTFYTYVVANDEREFCVSVDNDYDEDADPEYTGQALEFDALEAIATTVGATGENVPFAVIGHGENTLGGISSGGTAIADPTASSELANATANPTTIYTGPYNSQDDAYFDDIIWTPAVSDLEEACETRTPGGALNADISEDFAGANGDVDQTKFDTVNAGTEVQQQNGQAVFSDSTAYMTTGSSYRLSSAERPQYISVDWIPNAAATNAGFSIVTRAEATPSGGVFDPGITFRFFSTGSAGANTISIMDNGAQVAGFTSNDSTFTLTYGETYLLEVYDNGDDVWMQITQKNLVSNRAYAYATGLTGDTTETRVAFVNGGTSETRIDNLVIGRPMMVLDTQSTGWVETAGNNNGTSTGTITVEGWYYARTLPTGVNTATLVSQWDSTTPATTGSYRLYMSSGGALHLSLSRASTQDTEDLGESLTAGEWTHLAVTYDDNATYGEITVYINGALANTITGTVANQILGGGAIRSANEHFVVGANLNGTAGENIFDGMISEIRLWNDVRTAEEIAEWYDQRLPLVNSGGDTIHTGLVVNWRLDMESGGFGSAAVLTFPSGTDGAFQPAGGNLPSMAATLLFTHRTASTEICEGFKVGAFRCDFRNVVSNLSITGQDLGGIPTFYAKAWGGGGGADTSGGSSAPYDGGGGGYAGALFVNSGQDLTITVGAGGTSGVSGANGADSFLDQGSQRVTGNNGVRGQNNNIGDSGTGATTTGAGTNGFLVSTVIDPSVAADNRRPGCVPVISVVGDPCTDPHYTTTGAPVAEPGYGADGPLADHATGQQGAVVLFW